MPIDFELPPTGAASAELVAWLERMTAAVAIEVNRLDENQQVLIAGLIINGVQSNWIWSDLTAGDPGTGNVRGNQNTLVACTEFGISTTTALGIDLNILLDKVPPAPTDFFVVFNIERSVTALYTIDPPGATDNGTWLSFPVTYQGGNSANPAAGDAMGLRFKWNVEG